LVVAVSEYGYGDPAWNRSALDQDALRFRDWLLGRDVPQDNILFLIGPSATPERVRKALTEEVPQWRGDDLWVYWAGHGLLDDHKQLRLLLAGCPAADKRNLRLTDLLRLYRTKVLPGFARQQFIVDACRLFASDQAIRGLSGPLDLLSPGTEQACEQYVWLATQRGAAATYQSDRGGLFSGAVHAALTVADGLEWNPTIEELTTRVAEEARRRAADNPFCAEAQIPSRLTFLDCGEEVAFRDVEAQGHLRVTRPSGLLDDEQHGVLRSLLQGHPCWVSPRAIVEAVWPVADWAGELSVDEAMDPLALIERLDAALLPQLRLPPLLVFLEHLAAQCNDSRGAALKAFTGEIAQAIDQHPALLRERATAADVRPRKTVLLIKIEADEAAEDTYRLAAYVYRRGATLLVRHEDTRSIRGADVPARSEELIHRMSQFLAGLTEDLITYEFLLDRHQLDTGVEHWGVAPGLAGSDRIGWQSPVLVRSLDRIKDLRIHRIVPHWERRWRAFEGAPRAAEGLVGVIYQDEEREGGPDLGGLRIFRRASTLLRQDLAAARDLACVLLGFPYAVAQDERSGGLLDSVLMSGVPVALWWRQGAADKVTHDRLRSIAASCLQELPDHVLALRQAGHATDVTLLWDPPDPFPLRTSLLTPPPRLAERIEHS
jgi:hypothetical protein